MEHGSPESLESKVVETLDDNPLTSAALEDAAEARRRYVVGVGLLLASGALWSLSGALIKLTHQDGAGPHGVTIAFYRSLLAGLFVLPMAWGKFQTLLRNRHHRNSSSAREDIHGGATPATAGVLSRRAVRPEAIACVIFFTIMTACFVVANTMTRSSNVIILQYTSTSWIFLLSPLLLRESPRRGDVWILVIAMTGVAVIFGGNMSTDLAGLTVALSSGLFFGLLTLMIRLMRDADPAAVTVACMLGSAVLLLPFVLFVDGFTISFRSLVYLAILGVVQFGLPYYLYTLGLARVPAHQAALLTMTEPVLNPIWSFVAVGETVPLTTVAGGVIILAALVVFVLGARRRNKRMYGATGGN